MGAYLDRIDAAPPEARWPLVRTLMHRESAPFFAELRAERPVLALPELTFLTRHVDIAQVYHRFREFGVDLYAPKQGSYFMAQDDTADHWREKGVMRAILDYEALPAMRDFVAATAAAILDEAGGAINLPKAYTRAVPVALVQRFFGFHESDPALLTDWSYWNQQDAFHNQPFDVDRTPDGAHISEKRKASIAALAGHIVEIVKRRGAELKAGKGGDDSISRLLRLSFSGGIRFPVERVVSNAGGLLIGSVETTSHVVNHALAELFARPEVLEAAIAAAADPDPAGFDGYVWEALRLNPAFPYSFRIAHVATSFADDTDHRRRVEPGTTLILCTQSAMLDPAAVADPDTFDPTRDPGQTFTFGYGEHECLGRAIATAMVPEMVRQLLLRPGLHVEGPIGYEHNVPERQVFHWRTLPDGTAQAN
jgi:cytochrome P450